MSFSLNIEANREEVGAAAFHGLVAAAWVMFEAVQMIWMAKNDCAGLPPLEVRDQWVRAAFEEVTCQRGTRT